MTLYDELYFDITVEGPKCEIKKFISALEGGALDDFFEFSDEYVEYADDYISASDDAKTYSYLLCQDYGIEIEELDVADFLETICRLGKKLDIRGELYDADDDEYRFISTVGDSYYLNADKVAIFNDELDEQRRKEESDED
ncbi:MAG: hypothetical protein IIX96_03715 [Clostridia bacterium]|nr:hypothetical protein [Clostridia bacterium]